MNEALYRRIGERLRRRRRLLGLTQAQVAAACGTTFQQVQKYESGLVTLSVSRLIRLADVLQTPPANLLDPPGEPAAAEPPCPSQDLRTAHSSR